MGVFYKRGHNSIRITPSNPQPFNKYQPPQGLGAMILLVIVMIGFIYYRFTHVPTPPPGILVAEEPLQTTKEFRPVAYGEFTLTPRAQYYIHARVLHVEYYDNPLIPVDFAVGWGNMSDTKIIKQLSIWQEGRFFYYQLNGDATVSLDDVMKHAANMHIIPANDSVRKVIKKVRRNNIIELEGYLVDVSADEAILQGTKYQNINMHTSLTRDDTGAGACEIMLVEKAKIDY
jgi:hypothetical protein